MFGRKRQRSAADAQEPIQDANSTSDRTLTNNDIQPTNAQVRRATRTRLCWSLFASFLLLVSVIFLILVEVGCTSSSSIRSGIYFIDINLSDIIPVSVPNSVLINSIAQSLGLHDFYRVGLWGYCEGYNGQGVTDCSAPQTLYWFNPVEIIQSQLLAGATIALPADIDNILNLIRIVSHWMFGLFLTGACVNFLMIFIVPFSVISRWATFPIAAFTFLGALFTTVATVIATVLFIIFQDTITSATQLNIKANVGTEMFVFMWIAAGTSIIAWLVQFGLCCCCASRRDVRTGRKRGSKKAWDTETPGVREKPTTTGRRGLPIFGKTKRQE